MNTNESLRIVSLNVCRLDPGSTGGRERARRVGSLLSKLDAGLVAFQELEHAGHADSLEAFGDADSHWILGRHSRSGGRGVALRSRVSPLDYAEGRLAARTVDDKGYARGVFAMFGGTVEVIALHLDPISRRARHRQIAMLADAVGPAEMPRVVLGDLNAMTVGAIFRGRDHDDTVAILSEALGVRPASTKAKTFPNVFPLFAIDWILASPELELSDVHAVRAGVSDHAAIVADLRAKRS